MLLLVQDGVLLDRHNLEENSILSELLDRDGQGIYENA